MRPWGDGGTYFSRAEPPFCVCVCVTFWPSFLPRHVVGKVIGGGEIWMNSRPPSTFPPPTRGGAIAQSPSAYINPSTLQGEDIPTLVSLPLFPSLGDRQHKNTIHPFPPFPRFSPIPPKNGSVRSRTIHYLDQVNIIASPYFTLPAPENKLKKSETFP